MKEQRAARDDERARMIALFRYGVLAPLLEQGETERACSRSSLIKEIASRTHYLPGQGPIRLSIRTLYHWLACYRKGGLEALKPRFRKDKGRSRKIDDELLERAIALRKENAKRHTKTLIDILLLEGSLKGKPAFHRSTLDRQLDKRNASRRRLDTLEERRTIKMSFENFGDLWVGDYHHGPLVLGPDGQARTSKLGAFLDHTTRYPVVDRYYLGEHLATLRDSLLRALLKWGVPKRIYVDNGAVYRAEQLSYSLARLDCRLIHSRPYYSQGRGVVERWWQHADQFEQEVNRRPQLLTLPELNRFWEAYRERRYCQEIHSELAKTPAAAVEGQRARPFDPELARELFLVRERRRVHKSSGCVSVLGRCFLCESWLRGRRVEVRFDPSDLSSVLIFHDSQRVQRAFPQPLNARPEPHKEAPAKTPPSVDYLALLRDDFDRQLLEHARPLAYTQLRCDPRFDRERFVEVVAQLADLEPLRESMIAELHAFWESLGPVPEELVRIGLEHSVRLHGRRRHVRLYLHAIRTLLIAQLRNPDKEDSS